MEKKSNARSNNRQLQYYSAVEEKDYFFARFMLVVLYFLPLSSACRGDGEFFNIEQMLVGEMLSLS